MGMTESYLTILSDSLDKKIVILRELLEKNSEQTKLITKDKFDDEAFYEIAQQKDELIAKLNSLDEGFQTLYDKVKEEIQDNRSQYASIINEIKNKIRMILELSNHLQAEEKRNHDSIVRQIQLMKKDVVQLRQSQKTAANYYKNMNYAGMEPQFVDKKK